MTGMLLSDAEYTHRFWAHVQKTDGCWLWLGHCGLSGYGVIDRSRHGTRVVHRAHRYAWEQLVGPIPPGLHVLHGCDNPRCVRPGPGHLHLGTHVDNMAEMRTRNRAGREWQKPNTKVSDEDARRIFASREPGVYLAKLYGVSQQTICDIRKGRTRSKATLVTPDATLLGSDLSAFELSSDRVWVDSPDADAPGVLSQH